MAEPDAIFPWSETLSFETSSQALDQVFWEESMQTRSRKRPIPPALTLEWYQQAEKLRYGNQGKWMAQVFEFNKHSGERVLCIGKGLGSDWVQFGLAGADIWVATPGNTNDHLIRRNFQLRGLSFHHAQISDQGLPFSPNQFDLVLTQATETPELSREKLSSEIFRILKPGGKIMAVGPAKFHLNYFLNWVFPRKDFASKNSHRITGMELKQLYHQFPEYRIHKRHLQKRDLPPLLRWIPIPLIQRSVGKFLIFKGIKPLSMALPALKAA